MKTHQKNMPVFTLLRQKNRINLSDDRFQRSAVWTRAQEQLLIDTILKELDIPKLYFWSLKKGSNYEYAVVDGQQRLTTIMRFVENEFALSKEYTPDLAGMKFKDLDMDTQSILDSYNLSIVFIEEANLDDIRDLFLRLQNGTTLKSAEKRINLGGNMSDFINDMAKHNVFERVPFNNKHRDFEQVLAQCMLLELRTEPTNTQNKYLNEMYIEEKDFDMVGTVSKKFKKVLDYMNKCFDDKTIELKRFNFTSLYLLISQLIDEVVLTDKNNLFSKFLIDFWQTILKYRKEVQNNEDVRNLDYDKFITAISSKTDSLEAIKLRHETFIKYFMLKNPDLITYDNQRNFTEEQRVVIYRRDNMVCWHCAKHVDWVDFEADHRPTPHSKGGKTSVENGVCTHKVCNLKASNKEGLEQEWLNGDEDDTKRDKN